MRAEQFPRQTEDVLISCAYDEFAVRGRYHSAGGSSEFVTEHRVEQPGTEIGQALLDFAVYENVRQHNRRLGNLDQDYTRLLLEARQRWIAGDVESWRGIPEQMTAAAKQTGSLIDDLLP